MWHGNVDTVLKYKKKRARWENSTGNCTFDPVKKLAYSYKWWIFVKKIRGKVVFNDYTYSSSTSCHQSAVRDIMKQLRIKIDLTVYNRESLSEFSSKESPILEKLYRAVFLGEYTLNRKGLTEKTRSRAERSIKDAKKDIKQARSLGAGYPKNKLKALRKEVEESEKSRLEFNRKDRIEKTVPSKEVKEELNDLGEISFLESFNESDSLDPINMTPMARA